jgi:hypothetical protein
LASVIPADQVALSRAIFCPVSARIRFCATTVCTPMIVPALSAISTAGGLSSVLPTSAPCSPTEDAARYPSMAVST